MSVLQLISRFTFLWIASIFLAFQAHAEPSFLTPEQAFQLQASVTPQGQVLLDFSLAPQTHLYRDRFKVTSLAPEVTPSPLKLPPGQMQFDEAFGKEVEIYHGQVSVQVGVEPGTPAGTKATWEVSYQGCADAGLCYPPQKQRFEITTGESGTVRTISPEGGVPASSSKATPSTNGRIEQALASGNLLSIVGVFVVAGLLLSFTPCVLPMMPILSSVIVGEGKVGRLRGFTLALSYSQGMALVYTLLGVAAGMLGEGLAASLQQPWVLACFGLLMVLLALSMFDAYELQMPGFIQAHLSKHSNRFQGGSLIGVFFMGMLSALIVGPCVSAPLAGALVYISQTKNVVMGGLALYAMACGMSVPLLLLGISAGTLLPQAGRWMETVKTFFGIMLLGVAWWLVSPLLPPLVLTLSLGALLALAATFTGGFDTLKPQASLRHRAALALGMVLALLSAIQILGGLAGAQSPWDPLRPFLPSARAESVSTMPSQGLKFKRVGDVAELDQALAQAAQAGRTVMLDFYADWCVSCKEMEHYTFSDPRVQEALKHTDLLQVDVTANSAKDKALLKRFGLFGPPGIIFWDDQGQENKSVRVIGFQAADTFLQNLSASGIMAR